MKKAANIVGIVWITSKHVIFRQNQNLGHREAVGGKDVILLLHPLRWEWRCSTSFIISSLILFSSDFLHTSAMWVYFSECESALIFCWQVWSLWKTNGHATVAVLGLGFVSRGKKALSEIYFYQLISRSCWCVSTVVISIPSSSLRSGVMVRQGMQQPAWLLISMARGLTPSKLCPWIQGHIPQEELAYRYTEFCQSSAEVLSNWWLTLIFPLPRGFTVSQ